MKYSSSSTEDNTASSETETCSKGTEQQICFVHCLVIIGWRVEDSESHGKREQASPYTE